jgi:protease I
MADLALKQKPETKFEIKREMKEKKTAMIIAFKDFRDEEYFIPRQVFKSGGSKITTVSSELGKAIGTYGGEVNVDITLDKLKVDDFDAIIFIGGSGALKYTEDEICWKIAQESVQKNKVLGAICVGPVILARAGVLSGKKATVWSSPLDKSAVKILKEEGAIFEDNQVVQDGNIITANGPQAARKFGETILRTLGN